jgi:hypothetical protein
MDSEAGDDQYSSIVEMADADLNILVENIENFDQDTKIIVFLCAVCKMLLLMHRRRRRKRGRTWGGSRPGKMPNISRNHLRGHNQLVHDYFSEKITYTDVLLHPSHVLRHACTFL